MINRASMKRHSQKRAKLMATNYQSTVDIYKAAGFIPDTPAVDVVDETKLPVLERITCRKCISQFMAGKEKCSYCNNALYLTPVVEATEEEQKALQPA